MTASVSTVMARSSRAADEGGEASARGTVRGNLARLAFVEMVPLSRLLPADSPRSEGEDAAHTRALAESKAKLPPIVVHRPTMRVVDGMHRLRAAALQGRTEIEVQFFDGSEQDAFVLAVEANVEHGLQLTRKDRTAAAQRIMASHPHWSDRAIASAVGLSVKTVGSIRRRATEDIPQLHARVGLDGRIRPVSTADGRRIAAEFMTANPQASLREVAAAAGISTGTVRDVRERLRRDDDPVPVKQRSTGGSSPDHGGAAAVAARAEEPAGARSQESILLALRKDPSLRFTEAGRSLLRLLDNRAYSPEFHEQLMSALPPHSWNTVADAARQCAQTWLDLAERLERGAPGQ